jgi:uncharacterized repeat protein (TIGR03803 family)
MVRLRTFIVSRFVAILVLIVVGSLPSFSQQASLADTVAPASGAHSLDSAIASPLANRYEYKPLYSFCDSGNCPSIVNGDLIFDHAGNLYGTTYDGGACQSCGTVFELSPSSDGTWKRTTLFEFNGKDEGGNPRAGLAMDAAGNLYGTTTQDGAFGDGTVFELSPLPNGTWTLTTILAFDGENGAVPQAHLIFDTAGNLYGTTIQGGDSACNQGCGTVFELSPTADGTWKQTTLFEFNDKDGVGPYCPLVFDAAGNLYGTTVGGGEFGDGTVFELSPTSNGVWRRTTLFAFDGSDGAAPQGGLVLDTAGNLYGTTGGAGQTFHPGTVFQLSLESNGTWKLTTILAFDIRNGSTPNAGLVFDPAGNLYGNANDGSFGEGIVYRLSPQRDGKWEEMTLLTFNLKNSLAAPVGVPLLDAAGNLYDSASQGGKLDGGVVFELSPVTGQK